VNSCETAQANRPLPEGRRSSPHRQPIGDSLLSRFLASSPRPCRSSRSRAFPALACIAACLCWTSPACSASSAGLVVVPHPISQPGLSYFKLLARPGRTMRVGTIELRNPTARALRVVLAAVDGATLDTLGSTYRPYGSRRHGSTRWLRLLRRAVILPARGRAVVPVAIRVPRAVRSGDYLSGISIETLHQRTRANPRRGISIASVVRYAIGVEITLPGPRHPLIRFTGATLERRPSGLAFLLDAGNRGNVILQGVHGHVRITRAGRAILSRPIAAGTFLAHTAIAYPEPAFGETPAEGTRYRISAWLRYPGGIARLDETLIFGHRAAILQQRYGTHTRAHAGAAWWKAALLAAALVYGLLTTILLLRRRSREPAAPRPRAGKASPHNHLGA
jgi:hypothetical protein